MLTEIKFNPELRSRVQGHIHSPAPRVVEGGLEALFLDAQRQLLLAARPRRSAPKAFSFVSLGFLAAMLFGK